MENKINKYYANSVEGPSGTGPGHNWSPFNWSPGAGAVYPEIPGGLFSRRLIQHLEAMRMGLSEMERFAGEALKRIAQSIDKTDPNSLRQGMNYAKQTVRSSWKMCFQSLREQ